jgi:MATE family multidrug resistance protein
MIESCDLESTFISKEQRLNNSVLISKITPEDMVNLINSTSKEEDLKIWKAIKEITWIALPTMLFFMALFLMQTINLIFIGHIFDASKKNDALNGIGISHLYINCLFLSIVIGIISGYETLGSNAFGAKNYKLMGLYFHRAQIISYILTFLLLIFHFFYAVKIISLFGIDEKVLAYVEEYIKILMLFVLFDVQFSINFRHLNIIEKSHVNLIILITTLLLHPLWCYIFIIVFNMGIRGAAFCLLISQFLNLIGGVFYILVFKPFPETIFFYNRNSFKGWTEFLKIAVPSTFLTCAEWWAYEILSIIAIWISELDYTVHILLSNLNGILYTVCIGFGMTTSIIVGKNISEKGVGVVKKYIKIIYIYGFSMMFVVVIILFIFKNKVLSLFLDDEDVLAKGRAVIPILCIANLFDVTQSILSSVCRGLGKQLFASLITFFNFYVTQTLFGILLGKFMEMGVFGIWLGEWIGVALSAISYCFLLYFYFDFRKIQTQTFSRLQKDSQILNPLNVEVKDENLMTNQKIMNDKFKESFLTS